MSNSRKHRQIGKRCNNKKQNKLPARWNKYTSMGMAVHGTRFLPFKTPLREEILKSASVPENCWFTPAMLLEKAPNLKLIIDLTQTDRYYRKEDFVPKGIIHKKIICPGGGRQLPPRHIIHEFITIIDAFLRSKDALDTNALIGVHCTHGLNRTGYLICKYMVQRDGVSARRAIQEFESARGHKMERDLYVNDILATELPPCPPPYQPPCPRPYPPPCSASTSRRQNPVPRMVSSHSYHQSSPLDGCYNENTQRGSDRYFYPKFR